MKKIKYLGINLPKETKDLYIENYKTPMEETKDDINRWRNIPSSKIRRINIVKMSILPQSNLYIQCNPYKATNGIGRTNNFTIYMEIQKKQANKQKNSSNSQSNLEKEEWNWRNQPA